MDYEKAYKEALERAKEFHKSKEGIYVLAAETIFPELRESEDEKIRKYILQVCKDCVEVNDKGLELSMSTTKKLLAYLEKQKEPEKEELVYRLNGLMQEYINEAKDQEEEEHRFKCYKLFWDALEDASYFEQKEQKPVEWGDGDEERLKNTSISFLKDFADKGYENAVECIDWLKSKLNGNPGK